MYSVVGNTTSLVLGFPIRTSSDQRSVGSSPRHIAASNVLHRLPVPRHPPCALKHLQHKTVKNSRKNQKLHYQRNKPPQPQKSCSVHCEMLATTIHKSNTTPHHQSRATTTKPSRREPTPHQAGQTISGFPHSGRRDSGLVVSKPNSVSDDFPHDSISLEPQHVCCAPDPHPLQVRAIHRIAWISEPPHDVGGSQVSWCSLERR